MEKIIGALIFMLVLVIAGCGGGSNNSRACGTAVGGVKNCSSSSSTAVGRAPMPDSPYAPRM
jgi:hypothetical protein